MKIYQLHIVLKRSEPKIWRRILVPSDVLLPDLHKIIQTTMGWTNSHLHQFIKNEIYYQEYMEDDNDFWDDRKDVDYKDKKTSGLLVMEKDKVIYEYDFGDGWEHDIKLEKILPYDEKTEYPVCLEGKMNCPPEDCGGMGGYYQMLEILKDPKDEEYESYIEWLGGPFDPEYFDKDAINKLLKEDNYGCIEF